MTWAKPFFDVGLFTNKRDAQHGFLTERGLAVDHTLKLGGGVLQHRYPVMGAVLKLNDSRGQLPQAQGPIAKLFLALPGCASAESFVDPDGNRIVTVPPGFRDIQGLAVELQVASLAASENFYVQALGLELVAPAVLRCGQGLLFLSESCEPRNDVDELAASGARYLTLQVQGCDSAYAAALATGATSGRAPVTMGTTARVAFVKDPDGVWIELSERASLTGKAV
ncbi:MAG TPA: VOC family protein [Pseudomonas xinjiangensis]|uniref:VOC family protein n=2 Tax=root TaxID=1 RepID=A0A7V1BNM7_9GAMM|nr:VOC family protein [Halopseudomonas xinjiangensis]HEC49097.1 VOC family protein [Halopseudomonas xinjiangensis]